MRFSIRIDILVGTVSVGSCTKFRHIVEADARGNDVPHCLELAVLAEVEQTVDSGIERKAEVVCLGKAECAERIGILCNSPFEPCIVILGGIREVPVHSVIDSRRSLYVSEHGKCRQADAEGVLHTVAHLFEEIRLSHLGTLEVDLVVEVGCVVEGNVFIEFPLSNHHLSLERVDSADGEGKVREGYGIRAVS